MIRLRLGLKALGLCAMLVGMFAFAGTAQAEPGAFWLVNGHTIDNTLLPIVEAEKDTKGILLTTLGGKEIDISCEKILLVGAHLVEPNGKILGKIVFHECDFLSLVGGVATLQKACEPFVKENKGLIETETITGLLKLHSDGTIVLLATPPAETGLFATINLGEECAFGEKLLVGNGENKAKKEVLPAEFTLKDCENKALVDQVKHLVEEFPALTKLYVNKGETTAKIDGSAWAFLGGAHTGLTWAAHV
jgi:hypothetical protein